MKRKTRKTTNKAIDRSDLEMLGFEPTMLENLSKCG